MDKAFRVAVIGAGPSGLYTAAALSQAKLDFPVLVDIFERLPTPFGLIRYGVAPDHKSIKSIAETIAKVFHSDRVRFIGMAKYGQDFTRKQLLSAYDAVVYACGAERSVKLGIPGQDLSGAVDAADFVSWYSGHPDANPQSLANVNTIATIGLGNVAVDICRILLKTSQQLSDTDMPGEVLSEIKKGRVHDVYIIGRRGIAQAAFTNTELKELINREDIDVIIEPQDWDPGDGEWDRRVTNNIAALRAREQKAISGNRLRLHIMFWAKPVEILPNPDATGTVGALVVERTKLDEDGRVVGTGEFKTIECQRVFGAIGYRPTTLPDVPQDPRTGRVLTLDDRVVDSDNQVRPREYAVGWCKRGPDGVIGTNKKDAKLTCEKVLADLTELAASGSWPSQSGQDLVAQMRKHGIYPTTLADWRLIDEAEMARGKLNGRYRTKLAEWQELLQILNKQLD